ncbi:LysR family transcriptional regulator [Microbacterium horticulturae]|uniref:LysR family transcriptional regulator n=1 Tax=Microbacterium horticulturae TaxID=3028316 RepID=A0ABY8BWC1_9MICO|nr:LysR family transcriptional regulator [Microbacterium sp. KACC 23027]WEG08500.1 LysR family transcriptional regulator [Microbacterium sp. KACC 23027]
MSDLRGIDVNLLVVLDAILTERNLTRAGESIGLTQPGVSGAVAKLRKLFDDPLLVRGGRMSELTPKALELQPIVREAMAEIARTLNMRPMFDPRTTDRQFRITASDYALSVMTAPLLDVLEEQAPGVSVEFSPLINVEPIDLLREDVVVASATRLIPGKHQALFSDTMSCIISADNPRLRNGALTLEDLTQLPYVQVALAQGVVMFADEALTEAGVSPSVARIVPGFLPVPFTVAGTAFFGFAPTRLAELYADELGLAIAQLPLRLPVLVESAYWHPSRTDDPALSWLLGVLRTVSERIEFADGTDE